MNEIPEKVDDLWYRGKPYVFIKNTAMEKSCTMRNAAVLNETLLTKYRTIELIPSIIILYTDGRPEHHTNFLYVKIAITVLYHSLNADMILHLQNAAGQPYRNPPETANCILTWVCTVWE